MINRNNWDKDVIEARTVQRQIINELGSQHGSISKYAATENPDRSSDPVPYNMRSDRDAYLKRRITLLTILNDYENAALGIRHGILDEQFLFQFMRSHVLDDWKQLSPLVYEIRGRAGVPQLYVEFEGLAAQWDQELSYCTGMSLALSRRRIWVSQSAKSGLLHKAVQQFRKRRQ